MKRLVAFLAFIPCVASAQTYSEIMQELLADKQGMFASQQAVSPVYPVVPQYPYVPSVVVPPVIPPHNNYGTGYSVVTTERVQPDYMLQYMGIRDATVRSTVTSVVPNNANGYPVRPFIGYPYP